MVTQAAVLLCLVDALKAAAREHQPRWNWRFEPYIQSYYGKPSYITSLVGGGHYTTVESHALEHGHVVRLRRPRIINGMVESPRDYIAAISHRFPIQWPVIVCKQPKQDVRLLCIDPEYNITCWVGRGWNSTDPHVSRYHGLPDHKSIPFRSNRHVQYITYSIKPVVSRNGKLKAIPIQLLIASEVSFATVAQQLVEILHKSYEHAHGVGRSRAARLMRYGLAVRLDGPNTTYDPWRWDHG